MKYLTIQKFISVQSNNGETTFGNVCSAKINVKFWSISAKCWDDKSRVSQNKKIKNTFLFLLWKWLLGPSWLYPEMLPVLSLLKTCGLVVTEFSQPRVYVEERLMAKLVGSHHHQRQRLEDRFVVDHGCDRRRTVKKTQLLRPVVRARRGNH